MVLRTNIRIAARIAAVILGCFFCIVFLSGFTSIDQEKAYHWYQNARYFHTVRKAPLKAFQCLEKALELDPENITIRKLMEEVRKDLDMDRTPTPVEKENAVRWAQKGLYHKRSEDAGSHKKAIMCFEKALLYDPTLVKARDLLDETREKLQYSLADEVLANQAREKFKEAKDKLSASAWQEATDLFEEAARLDKRLLEAHLYLLMLARRSGATAKEQTELKLIMKIMRFSRVSAEQKKQVDDTLACLAGQNQLQAAMEEYGYLVAARKSSWDDVIEQFFDPLPEYIAAARQGLNQIPTGLDIGALVDDGFIPQAPACPSGGKYFLTGDGLVWCTIHGLKPPAEGTLTVTDARDAHLAGRHFLELGRPGDARKQFEKSLQLLAGDAEVHSDLGLALLRQGKAGESIARFDEAIKLDPKQGTTYVNRAAARQTLGQYDEAVDDLEKARVMGIDSLELHYSLAYLETRRENFSRAIAEYIKVDELLPDDDPRKERIESLIRKLRKLNK